MGLTFVKMKVRKIADSSDFVEEKFLVDSGAVYTVMKGKNLTKLGISPHSRKEFELANGETIERDVGDAHFEYSGKRGASPVVFGQKGDSNLLGILTLEALGFVLDPIKRELKPLQMILAKRD